MKLQSTAKMPFILAFALVIQSNALLADDKFCLEGPFTPGFWKNDISLKKGAWEATGHKPTHSFAALFSVDLGITPTLQEALNLDGGGANALARHAVAALLNASVDCSSTWEYPYDTDTITGVTSSLLNAYQLNLSSKSDVSVDEEAIEDQKDIYECYNEHEC